MFGIFRRTKTSVATYLNSFRLDSPEMAATPRGWWPNYGARHQRALWRPASDSRLDLWFVLKTWQILHSSVILCTSFNKNTLLTARRKWILWQTLAAQRHLDWDHWRKCVQKKLWNIGQDVWSCKNWGRLEERSWMPNNWFSMGNVLLYRAISPTPQTLQHATLVLRHRLYDRLYSAWKGHTKTQHVELRT